MQQRHIQLKGTVNFRDIGGYETSAGQTIKSGMIFRSARLSRLSKADIRKIEGLGIKLVIDLRTNQERDEEPSRLTDKHVERFEHLCLCSDSIDLKALYKKVLTGKTDDFDFHEFMLSEYRGYVTEHDEKLKKIFELLLDKNNYPVLIHCNGGKDRTGTVSALIQLALGVSTESVFHNYMLSHDHLKKAVSRMKVKIKVISLLRANIAQLAPMLDTHSLYLHEALSTIDKKHGDMDSYLAYLGMHNESRRALTELMCS